MESMSVAAPPYADLPVEPDEIFERILDWRLRGDDLVRLYHQLRAVAPVWRASVDRLGNPWVITRHADASGLVRDTSLVKDARTIGLAGVGDGGPWMQTVLRMFAFLPREPHARMRGLVNRGFTPRSIEKLRPRVQALVDALIDDVIDERRMELVSQFAFRVPVTVICQMLGAPLDDVPRIERWASDFARRSDEGEALTPEIEKLGDDSATEFASYLRDLVGERRRSPSDDLLSRLLEVQREAPDLTDDDISATVILLFQAGHETTANLIAKGSLALIRHPEQAELLRKEPERIEDATEELLRFDTPVQLTTKFATKPIPFHDQTIEPGDPVTLVWGAINRDPAHFHDPDRLDLRRSNLDHYSFGMGANYCLGASLARLEIQHAIGTLFRRLPGLRVGEGEIVYKPQLHLHGLSQLPVAW